MVKKGYVSKEAGEVGKGTEEDSWHHPREIHISFEILILSY